MAERCRRVNTVCQSVGSANVILVSIHANGFGNGKEWTSPTGWGAYITKGQTKADLLADALYIAARKYLQNMRIRTDMKDGDANIEEDFYILRKILCPAVMTENLFMTNEKDVAFLKSEECKHAIVNLRVEGICNYLAR